MYATCRWASQRLIRTAEKHLIPVATNRYYVVTYTLFIPAFLVFKSTNCSFSQIFHTITFGTLKIFTGLYIPVGSFVLWFSQHRVTVPVLELPVHKVVHIASQCLEKQWHMVILKETWDRFALPYVQAQPKCCAYVWRDDEVARVRKVWFKAGTRDTNVTACLVYTWNSYLFCTQICRVLP